MAKKQKTAVIGLITLRHKQKKEKPVFVPQPLPQRKPEPEPVQQQGRASVPAKETLQIPEIPQTEDRLPAADMAEGHPTPAGKTMTPEGTLGIPEPQNAAEQPDTAEQPETIPQTDSGCTPGAAPRTDNTPEREPSADTKAPDLPEPEFTLQQLDITTRVIPETELPESVTGITDLTHAYAVLKKTNQEGLLESYPRAAYFNLFLQEMYKRARTNGTVRYYEYAGKKSLDFPIENEMGTERLFASFIPHDKEPGKWFFLGVRKGGKIHDLAYPGKPEDTYRHMRNLTDLKAAGIRSGNELQVYLEDVFLKAAEEKTVFLYTIGNDTMVEYPTGLYRESDDTVYVITCVYTFSPEKKWSFKRFRFRETEHELTESIRLDEAKLWRRAERSRRREEQKQRRAEQAEAEYKARERKKTFIPFDPFPVKRIQPDTTADCFGDIGRFAYIGKDLYVYLPEADINLMDDEEIRGYMQDAFKECNPYADIDYYSTESEGEIAELKVTFPQNPDKEVYAVFARNMNRQKQPWYFKRFEYNSRFRRMFNLGDITSVFEQLNGIISEASRNLCGLESPEALEALMQRRFFSAIGCDKLFVYGAPPLKRAELPLYLKTEDGSRVLAYFTSGGSLYKWKFSGFKIRPGSGDERISISEEYKAEYAAKLADAEKKQRERETEREKGRGRDTKETAAPERFEHEPVPEHATSVTGPDGNPISLMDFCKEIKERELYYLAAMAEEEKWGFSAERPFGILYKYLNVQFIRSGYEQKLFVRYTREGTPEYAVMHTGLFTRGLHEPIYAGFKAAPLFSPEYTGPLWKLDGFCCKSEGGCAYDNITAHFRGFPENVDFMHENGEYIPLNHYHLDLKEHITLKEEHILKERGYRLPKGFLRKVFNRAKDGTAAEYLDILESLKTEEEQKEFWINTFSAYLEETPETYDNLLQLLQVIVEEAQTSGIRKPIPTYYPRDNRITWLLPLRFHEESDLRNLALVVGRRDAGGYKGITLMNIEAVYHRARVIENPDGSWLKREILDRYVIDPEVMIRIGEDEGAYVSEASALPGEEAGPEEEAEEETGEGTKEEMKEDDVRTEGRKRSGRERGRGRRKGKGRG